MIAINIGFNGTPLRKVHETRTKAQAVDWMHANAWRLERGQQWLLENKKGDVSFDMDAGRTVKPMGWGFKSNKWEVQGGRAVTGASTYQPAPEYRRTK